MGLIGGIARTAVAAGTWTAVSNGVSRRQAGRWAAEDQSHPHPGYMPPPPGRYQRPMFQTHPASPPQVPAYAQQPVYAPPPPPVNEMAVRLAQLEQLGTLKAQGILTDAEFDEQKRRILGVSTAK